MKNFLFVYKGGGMPEGEEAQKAVWVAWSKWYEEIGDEGVVDKGNPCGDCMTVLPDASSKDGGSSISGYSILKLESMDVAVKVAGMCPVLAGGATVEVCEILPMM